MFTKLTKENAKSGEVIFIPASGAYAIIVEEKDLKRWAVAKIQESYKERGGLETSFLPVRYLATGGCVELYSYVSVSNAVLVEDLETTVDKLGEVLDQMRAILQIRASKKCGT